MVIFATMSPKGLSVAEPQGGGGKGDRLTDRGGGWRGRGDKFVWQNVMLCKFGNRLDVITPSNVLANRRFANINDSGYTVSDWLS